MVYFFWAGVLFSIQNAKFWPILVHFDQLWLFCTEITHFLMYFLHALIMRRCAKLTNIRNGQWRCHLLRSEKRTTNSNDSRANRTFLFVCPLVGPIQMIGLLLLSETVYICLLRQCCGQVGKICSKRFQLQVPRWQCSQVSSQAGNYKCNVFMPTQLPTPNQKSLWTLSQARELSSVEN